MKVRETRLIKVYNKSLTNRRLLKQKYNSWFNFAVRVNIC